MPSSCRDDGFEINRQQAEKIDSQSTDLMQQLVLRFIFREFPWLPPGYEAVDIVGLVHHITRDLSEVTFLVAAFVR